MVTQQVSAVARTPAQPRSVRTFQVRTYGCQMNVHDSERMAGLLDQAGYESTDDDRDADVIVINTCSVRERIRRHAPVAGRVEQGLEIRAGHAGGVRRAWRDRARQCHECAIQVARP